MNEPRKLAIVLLAIMVLGLVALAVEWLRMRVSGWLALIVLSLILLLMALTIHPLRAHDHGRPALNDWLKSLHSHGRAWCCNGDDTDAIDDWETRGSRYRVKFRGQWYDVPDEAIVEGPNRAGDAMLWMNKGYLGMSVRCFMPGSMT